MAVNQQRTRVGDRVTIYPRGKSKVYCADFWHADQHRRVSLETSNKKVATQRAVKLAADLDDGTYAAPVPPTHISTAVNRYLAFLESEGRARKTLVRYRGELETFDRFCAGRRVQRLGQIGMLLFDEYRADRRKVHVEWTVYHESVVVKQFLNWCRQRQLLVANPLQDYRLAKPRREPKGGPALEQVHAILAAARGPDRIHLAMLAFCGMRSGELRHLRPVDVDLRGNWVHIVSRVGAETKTRDTWKVPLHPLLKELLEPLPPRQHHWFFTAAPSGRYPEGGHWISTKKLNDRFLRTLRDLGLPAGRKSGGFTVHSLRHFFKTHCINAGVPKAVVDTWQGHRIDQTVGAQYYKLADADSQRFMNQVSFDTQVGGQLRHTTP